MSVSSTDRRLSAGGDMPLPPPHPPNKPKTAYPKRGKITVVACEPCRKRKTKCDGTRPVCMTCQARSGRCHYDMENQDRKLTHLRAEQKQRGQEIGALLSIVDKLRNPD